MTLSALVLLTQIGVTLQAERTNQPTGWMRGGWGNYHFILKNSGPDATIVRWSAHWEAGGKRVGGTWGGPINQALAQGKSVTREEVGYLPPDVVEAAKPKAPEMVGEFTVKVGADERSLPFRFEVPEAVLPEPLKTIEGKTVGMALMQSRYKMLKNPKQVLGWLDQCYSAMIDLTGQHPFGGKKMIYREAPEHPYWAYAGQEMILNTKFVPSTLDAFNKGMMSFGWVHEVGHNFDDQIGPWYHWNGACVEFQANFKLVYAVTRPEAAGFKMDWKTGSPAYGQSSTTQPVTGQELADGFFGTFGDAYLADPSRSWETMSSDDIHTLFQRLVMAHGWKPFKAWYRTYRRLADEGKKPPTTPEDKISLAVAILSKETGHNLVPVFKMWRMPVSDETVQKQKLAYGI